MSRNAASSVLLALSESSCTSALVHGFRQYVAHHDLPWDVDVVSPEEVDSVAGYAVVGAYFGKDLRGGIGRKGRIRIDFSGGETADIRFQSDDEAIGRMAAHFYHERGYRSIACTGNQRRGDANDAWPPSSRPDELGLETTHGASKIRGDHAAFARIAPILGRLAHGTGLFCGQDREAAWLLAFCDEQG